MVSAHNDLNNPVSIVGYGYISAEVVEANKLPEAIIKAEKDPGSL